MFCSKCGKEIPDESEVCPKCGKSLASVKDNKKPLLKPQKCKKCGSEIPSGDIFCPKCGNKLFPWSGCLMFIIVAVLIGFAVHSCGNDEKVASPPPPAAEEKKADVPIQKAALGLACIGSDVESFDKVLGKQIKRQDDIIDPENKHMYKNGSIAIYDNYKKPAGIEAVHFDFRKRISPTKIVQPETMVVNSLKEADAIINPFLPPDAKLLQELAYKDSRMIPPTSDIKIYRLYESTWLSDNFTPTEYSDNLPSNQFWVIIRKLDIGYQSAIIGVNASDWEDLSEDYMERSGWVKTAIPD